ncbi:4'-phosphopantetheinyl transferase family protein [Endozoicomonas arenosclerae]|uniref:4'-phosphopantetheinyl transferase family protein n=1 Tax=Endozoicomonas arenosclerae TaxID=1633495 RepID=UPI0007852A7F|nr:4'-phosphopantetheinyl transferase superfamily protein [Endozoicomonas arenosclerae]
MFFNRLLLEGFYIPENLSEACDKRIKEFLTGRYCAVSAMKLLCGIRYKQPGYGPDQEPIWPKGITGSISHTSEYCVAIACNNPNAIVGIDIENWLPNNVAKNISEQIVLKGELEFIECFDSYEQFVTVVFSAKEAIYKAILSRVKRFINFSEVQLSFCNEDQLRFNLLEPLQSQFPDLSEITVYWKKHHKFVECLAVVI